MKDTVNTYLAMLIITIAGAGAASLIVRTVDTDYSKYVLGNERQYSQLQKSILK